MPSNNETSLFTPDVLDCIANLSNDEVFTPPKLVNQVLDLLPPEIWHNKDVTFLDPACKSGVWLREITKRLINGLADEIPNLQERIDHILHKQVFGIAITELTSLLSRRSLYCSKYPNGKYSISHFDDVSGNIWFKNLSHHWKNGKCELCGASQSEYDRSKDKNNYAYGFIHCKPEYWEEVFGVKFDVIIGNPPYQLDDGGHGASATPIYQKFVEAAKALNPRYLCMIIPARWYSGGKGLDRFRHDMLNDRRISELHDFFDSTLCFPGVDISGGVCYFLWDNTKSNPECKVVVHDKDKTIISNRQLLEPGIDFFIRDNVAVSILKHVRERNETSFTNIVRRSPFGLATSFKPSSTRNDDSLLVYAYPKNGYVGREYIQNVNLANTYKIFIAEAYGERGDLPYFVTAKPFTGDPSTCSTLTYLMVGPFNNKEEMDNAISYMKTKFFRYLVFQRKNTQHASKKVYELVPLLNFSEAWSDDKLYKRYSLSPSEIDRIESTIKKME